MDIKDIYQSITHCKKALARHKTFENPSPEFIEQLSTRIDELEVIAEKSREWRKAVLDDHGIEWVSQDGEIFALGTCNTETNMWVWDNVTVCNLFQWLNY